MTATAQTGSAVRDLLTLYLDEQMAICRTFPMDAAIETAQQLIHTYETGGTVFAMANGGNSGTLDHCYVDFRHHPFVDDSKSQVLAGPVKRLTFVNLCGSPAELTGLVNDLGPEQMYAAGLLERVTDQDFVMAYTGSGNSPNVLSALRVARAAGARTFAMTKGSGGRCKELADICLTIPGTSGYPGQTGPNDNNFHFEDFMLAFNHMLVGLLRHHVTTTYR